MGLRATLSRWRVNVGHLLSTPVLLLAQPSAASVVVSLPLVLAGLALRAWARGHLDRGHLVEEGPYGFVRHPLYLGSFMIGLGFALMSRSPLALALYASVFPIVYLPQVRHEEAALRRRHGAAFVEYTQRVPALLPLSRRLREPSASRVRFSWRRVVVRHQEWRTWVGAIAVLTLMVVLARTGSSPWQVFELTQYLSTPPARGS